MLNLVANGPSGYNLTNSLRFRSSASAYLNRTPASAGNRKTWTLSMWVKRGALSTSTPQPSLLAVDGSSDATEFNFGFGGTTDTIGIAGWSTTYRVTTQVFRDPSAWYHLVLAVDTTLATANNRIRLYVNGSEVTAFSTLNNPTQNFDLPINNNVLHYIGRQNTRYFDGYITEINLIDGQALTPSSFGSTNATTGVWQPAKYTGTYGTNGFYLQFSNIATTSGSNTGLGKDFSGNGNYWNTNNISVTAGTTYDAMTDVPTLTSATVANYAVVNPIFTRTPNVTISYANLRISTSAAADSYFSGTMGTGTSGKYYYEMTYTSAGNAILVGVQSNPTTGNANGGTYRSNTGTIYNLDGTTATTGATFTTGDIIGVAINVDSGSVTFYKNNVSQGSFSFTAGTEMFMFGRTNGAGSETADFNFGQRPFSYTPPTGYVALNTYNLPTSTIVKGNKYMDATLYTGTGSALTVTNAASFQPDFVWLKSRSAAQNHNVFDSNRGTTKRLNPNLADFEDTASGVTSFNSNGFTLGTNSVTNTNTNTYVAWQWQAGQSTTSSNTSGNITSTVDVSTTAGCSIITYTGNGTSTQTVGHGLGVAPKFIIVKARSSGATMQGWFVWHTSLTSGYNLRLELTDAQFALSGTSNGGIGSSPSSTTFTLANGSSTNSNVNQSSQTYVAYCWAEIAGFSKFGSFTSNASANGTFVYLGFRPKYIMFKPSSYAGEQWYIQDSSRSPSNVATAGLYANLDIAEDVGTAVDLLSNGFKLRVANGINANSGATVIYAAFAESPFRNSLAR